MPRTNEDMLAQRLCSALCLRGGGGDGGVYPLTHAEMQWMTPSGMGLGGREGNKAWTHQDGRQFPAGYILTTDIATRESIGVTMVSDVAPAIYDEEYYWSAGNPKNLDELKTKKIADTKKHCADANESYFCSYQKNNHKLTPISAEGVVQLEEVSNLLKKDGCYFAGNGWPKAAEKNPQFLSQALGSAEPIAIIAKQRLETGEDFLPENANPVYLKTPDYKKS